MKKQMNVAAPLRRSWPQRAAIAILTVLPLTEARSLCMGEQAPLSAEDVVRAARDVVDKVHDGTGTAEHYEWTDSVVFGSSEQGNRSSNQEQFMECYNMAFIGPPRGPFRRDYKVKVLWGGGEPPELKEHMSLTGHNFENYFNGQYELEFWVDRGQAFIPTKFSEGFRDDYKRFHPLFQTDRYLRKGLQELEPFRITSYKAGVYTIERKCRQITLILAIDEKKGFSLIGVIHRPPGPPLNDFAYSRSQIEPVEWTKGIWLPGTIESEHYRKESGQGKGKLIMRERTRFSDLKLNIGLRPAQMEIPLPVGTELHDER